MKRRRPKTLDAGKEARRRARQSGVKPSATRVVPDKRRRPPKHKENLLVEES